MSVKAINDGGKFGICDATLDLICKHDRQQAIEKKRPINTLSSPHEQASLHCNPRYSTRPFSSRHIDYIFNPQHAQEIRINCSTPRHTLTLTENGAHASVASLLRFLPFFFCCFCWLSWPVTLGGELGGSATISFFESITSPAPFESFFFEAFFFFSGDVFSGDCEIVSTTTGSGTFAGVCFADGGFFSAAFLAVFFRLGEGALTGSGESSSDVVDGSLSSSSSMWPGSRSAGAGILPSFFVVS